MASLSLSVEAREEDNFNGAISSIATRTKCLSVLIIQYSVYEINDRSAKFDFELRCIFLHRALGGGKKGTVTSIKRKKCRKLIIVEEVYYIQLCIIDYIRVVFDCASYFITYPL